jgi:hypothetical protein
MLNGSRLQDGNTNNMIFSVAEIVSFLSQGMTLLPGKFDIFHLVSSASDKCRNVYFHRNTGWCWIWQETTDWDEGG